MDFLDVKKALNKKDKSADTSKSEYHEIEFNDLGDDIFEGGREEEPKEEQKNFIDFNKK